MRLGFAAGLGLCCLAGTGAALRQQALINEPEQGPVCKPRTPPPATLAEGDTATESLAREDELPAAQASRGKAQAETELFKDDSAAAEFLEKAHAAGALLKAESQRLSEVFNTTRAYVSMATLCYSTATRNGTYLNHALILARGLQAVKSRYPLVLLVSDYEECDVLKEFDGRVIKDLNLAFVRVPPGLFKREDMPFTLVESWRFTYPKSYVFAMESFERIVYLDADVLMLRNSDDLFDLPDEHVLRMGTNQRGCRKRPFEDNKWGGASNIMVLQPFMPDFHALQDGFVMARKRNLWQEGSADDQSIIAQHFQESSRLVILPPGDMLYSECLTHFNCDIGRVRAMHLGNLGRILLQVHMVTPKVDMDSRWRPIFKKWVASCHSKEVKDVCNHHCHMLCPASMSTVWDCEQC